jgi:hypothetical protein
MDAKDRPLRLTYFKLRYHIGVSLLDECKAYFQDFAHTPKCFDDLRPILCDLPPEEWKQFSVFIFAQSKQYTMEIQERIDNGEVGLSALLESLIMRLICVLRTTRTRETTGSSTISHG